jgi:hypothetical protein
MSDDSILLLAVKEALRVIAEIQEEMIEVLGKTEGRRQFAILMNMKTEVNTALKELGLT